MRPTPHLIIAAVLLLIAGAAGLPALAGSIGAGWPSPETTFRLSPKHFTAIPAAPVTAPLVAGLDDIVRDPFTLKGVTPPMDDLPPPPPVSPPALPVLPLPEK
ncbi:hypothetical protein LBMAG53_02000 [Planctomycetota bacterium]|nr:hypothetical protein LBMAG53_02000 [Planctomycetota bacterium]